MSRPMRTQEERTPKHREAAPIAPTFPTSPTAHRAAWDLRDIGLDAQPDRIEAAVREADSEHGDGHLSTPDQIRRSAATAVIHADPAAHHRATALDALGVTEGRSVWLARQRPTSHVETLAHEFAHVAHSAYASNVTTRRRPIDRDSASLGSPSPAHWDTAPSTAPHTASTPPSATDVQNQANLSDRFLAINNAHQSIFENQIVAINELEKDLETKEIPGLFEGLVCAIIEAALSKGFTAIASRILSAVNAAAVGVIATHKVRSYSGYIPPGLEAADLVDLSVVRARATAVTNHTTKWVTGKIEKSVPSALAAISRHLKPTGKFIQGQRIALAMIKRQQQDLLTDVIAPSLRAGSLAESVAAADTLREGLRKGVEAAQPLQYVQSVGEWAEVLRDPRADPIAQTTGVLRIEIGHNPASAPSVEGARLTGMKESVLQRIAGQQNLSDLSLADLPIHIIVTGPVYIYKRAGAPVDLDSVRSGGAWLTQWAFARRGLSTGGDLRTKQMVGAALLLNELGNKRLGELGQISHGT